MNVHLDAVEHSDDIVFMHKVKAGAANQSYGLQVAKLAGIPPAVIKNAKEKLAMLETHSLSANSQPQLGLFAANNKDPNHEKADQQYAAKKPAMKPSATETLDKLAAVNPDDMTPKEALEALYELKRTSEEVN